MVTVMVTSYNRMDKNSSILLSILFVPLLLFNAGFVSHAIYANSGAMGGSMSSSSSSSSPPKTQHKDNSHVSGGNDNSGNNNNDGNNAHKQSSKTHHKDKDKDNNNGGFPSPAITDDTLIQQACLDGLAPITASNICTPSQTPTNNIPPSPAADLVAAAKSKLKPQFTRDWKGGFYHGDPPAGVKPGVWQLLTQEQKDWLAETAEEFREANYEHSLPGAAADQRSLHTPQSQEDYLGEIAGEFRLNNYEQQQQQQQPAAADQEPMDDEDK
jgi:hypothetical protein